MMDSAVFVMFKVILIALSLLPSEVRSGELISNVDGKETTVEFTVEKEDLGYEESGDSYYLTNKEDGKGEVLAFTFSDNALYEVSLLSVGSDNAKDIVELDVADVFSEMFKYKDQVGKETVTLITSDGYEIVITPQDGKLIVSNSDTDLSITVSPEEERIQQNSLIF